MSNVTSVEQYVLCEPQTQMGLQREKDESGFTQFATKKTFTVLKVVADSEFKSLKAGDYVYLTAETAHNAVWTKTILDLNGKQVIIVPNAAIVAIVRA